jgi:hypothetical protein
VRRLLILALLAAAGCKTRGGDGAAGVKNDGDDTVESAGAFDVRAMDLTAAKAFQWQYANKAKSEDEVSAGVKETFGDRFAKVDTYVEDDLMVTVAASADEVAYMIRGTEVGVDFWTGASNWVARNLYASPTTLDDGVLAPVGFANFPEKAYNLLKAKGAVAANAGKKQIFIGHSLGGATAQVLMYLMAKGGDLAPFPYAFIYGAPVAGNRNFYRALFAKATVRKFYHPDDPVPRVPFDFGIQGLLGGSYYPTDDINVSMAKRRKKIEVLGAIKFDAHLHYDDHLAALADNASVDRQGGQLFEVHGDDQAEAAGKAAMGASSSKSAQDAKNGDTTMENFKTYAFAYARTLGGGIGNHLRVVEHPWDRKGRCRDACEKDLCNTGDYPAVSKRFHDANVWLDPSYIVNELYKTGCFKACIEQVGTDDDKKNPLDYLPNITSC